ncbi:EVE domain-containing protein [Fodinibius salinus]|uniref:EVE domain-containing protein n=1 Tax=Fodinibius salinus TaxID=860790 RepID=A0A5D3YRT1_9BACT|nr:EVE domain-containing protein [Fodinibius salinus]TYP95241.1 EVE domain-containing protein [Fodinibius salinus]
MNWIFQGNPKRFDIDDYLSRYSFIYWTANQLTDQMQLGDQIFIWRAGNQSGAIAKGEISELPKERSEIKNKEALGHDLWTDQEDEPSTTKVGIKVFEARLTPEEGMILRSEIKDHPKFSSAHIITAPQGTVFNLQKSEFNFLNSLWNFENSEVEGSAKNLSVYEGAKSLHKHYKRERNQKIIDEKKSQFKKDNGTVFCEVCSFNFKEKYPNELAEDFIEVHHLNPISDRKEEVKTTLDDLILICANCHRMVHRTQDAKRNLKKLKAHFTQNV